ncbi:MAG: DNA repair protein [Planctomycetota bacterium]
MPSRLPFLIEQLYAEYGPRGWWPLTAVTGEPPRYSPTPCSEFPPQACSRAQIFEIGVGAVLVQRVTWRAVANVIAQLSAAQLLRPEALLACPTPNLETLVRSCGTYRRKVQSLREWALWLSERVGDAPPAPHELRPIRGFGPETVDSILLYGYGVPRFIADAYARRVLGRIGILSDDRDYERSQREIVAAVELDRWQCDEGHALLVEVAKNHCRTKPDCNGCPLTQSCDYWRRGDASTRGVGS